MRIFIALQFDEEIKMEDLNFFKDSDIGTGTFGEVKKCLWRKTLVAVKFLKKAMENGFENYNYLKHDPDLNCLQNEPDFLALMKGK